MGERKPAAGALQPEAPRIRRHPARLGSRAIIQLAILPKPCQSPWRPVRFLGYFANHGYVSGQDSLDSLGALISSVVVVGAGSANAAIVQVNGVNYNITNFTGSYNADTSKFQTSVNGGVMPWWGNQPLAAQFSTAAKTQPIVIDFPNNSSTRGPYFSRLSSTLDPARTLNCYYTTTTDASFIGLPKSGTYTFAQAVEIPPAGVPGPLPILGAIASFHTARRLRRRTSQRLQFTA